MKEIHATVLSVNVENGKHLIQDILILKRSSLSFVILTCSLNNVVFAKHMATRFPGSCLRASIMDITTFYSTEVTVGSMTINFQ